MGIDPKFLEEQPVAKHVEHDVYREKKQEGKLGIHGSAVGVDFEACIADGICLQVCPTNVFDWMHKDTGELKDQNSIKPEKNSEWKADPTREKDCIFCRACEAVCPTQAILITQK